MRSRPFLVLAFFVAAGCGQSEPTSASAATPSPEKTSPPRSSRPSRELMKDHFTAVGLVRDALIVGNLELAKWNASFLAKREPDPAIASWSLYVDHLREQAAKVAEAPTLIAAAAASTELALECGRCHAANSVTPAFASVDRRIPASGTRPHMLRHEWAAEQMWDGLIGPSEARWNAGTSELAEAPLGQDEIFANATATPAIARIATDVHALGAEGRKATTWTERAAIYGRLLASCAACHSAIPSASGFGGEGSGGQPADGAYGRVFDPKTVVTVSGTITSLGEITPSEGMGVGVHLMLRTKTESVEVHLGPRWYLESQGAHLKVGDAIEVRGSRIQIDNKPALVAVEIKRGDEVLILRDADGVPRWAGWRRRGPPKPS
jgi:hypothetical protein